MIEIKNHFLESNIVIGLSVEWDNQNPICSDYRDYAEDNFWFSSKKVIDEEVEPIVNGLRQDIEKLVEEADVKSIENTNNLINSIRDIVPEINKNSADKVEKYVKFRRQEFEDFIKGNQGLNKTLLMVVNDFDSPEKFILKIKKPKAGDIIYLDYSPSKHLERYRKEYSKLHRCMRHEDDVEVLLDSHHLSIQEKEEIAFISTDNEHIISNRERIESVLNRVSLFNPHEEIED